MLLHLVKICALAPSLIIIYKEHYGCHGSHSPQCDRDRMWTCSSWANQVNAALIHTITHPCQSEISKERGREWWREEMNEEGKEKSENTEVVEIAEFWKCCFAKEHKGINPIFIFFFLCLPAACPLICLKLFMTLKIDSALLWAAALNIPQIFLLSSRFKVFY